MQYNHFKVEIKNKIGKVIFNRPQKANALNMDAWIELQSIFESLSVADDARVVVLTGEGKHFCSGIDLELLMSVSKFQSLSCSGKKSEKIRELIQTLQKSVSAIEKCAKPVLAAIHSGCIGGGLDIASACDMRYCTEDAFFTIKEIDLGMVADLGTLQRLPKIIPSGLAAEMAYTGRKVLGPEAKNIGLVNNYYASKETMLESVMEIASTISNKSPLSIRGTKEILRYSRDHAVDEGLNYVATWNAGMLLSADLTEVFKASKEKRDPNFDD